MFSQRNHPGNGAAADKESNPKVVANSQNEKADDRVNAGHASGAKDEGEQLAHRRSQHQSPPQINQSPTLLNAT